MSTTVPESPEVQEERRQRCQQIQARIFEAMAEERYDEWLLSEALYEFNEEAGWTVLGYEKQKDWLASPEVTMTKSDFSRRVRRHRELRVRRNVPVTRTKDMGPGEVALSEIPLSKLDIVLPKLVHGEVELQQALHDALALGIRDLRREYEGTGAEEDDEADAGEDAGSVGGDEEGVSRLDLQLMESAGMVDSWFSLPGSDRRKALRHWRRLLELHPVLSNAMKVGACLANEPLGGDAVPLREETVGAWRELVVALGLVLPEAD